eukprot:c17420_g1_i1.p1 GENE.c17420_g1_i1~~c17420_g1_i1.p1  ORF type:complete len:611 (-),score=179.55 c17420_g1_i1:6-1802(-)
MLRKKYRRCEGENCGIKFTSFGKTKKFYCHECKIPFCYRCSATRASIPNSKTFKEVRVCKSCVLKLDPITIQFIAPLKLRKTHENGEPVKLQQDLQTIQINRTVWLPFEDAISCLSCERRFGIFLYKRHCHSCGNVFCWSCSSSHIVMLNFQFKRKQIHVCDSCFAKVAEQFKKFIPEESDIDISSPHKSNRLSLSSIFLPHTGTTDRLSLTKFLPLELGGSTEKLNSSGKKKTKGKRGSDISVSKIFTDTKDPNMANWIVKFNLHPKSTIEKMIQIGLINNSPESVAKFLRETPGLSKTMIGIYITQRSDFHFKVFEYFTSKVDFKGKGLDESIREFLEGWRMPGESQIIDRAMQRFAELFYAANPNIFHSVDAVYLVSFALIMLGTDLHNPNIKHPMTLKQFLRNLRGVDNGNDIPEALLTNLYNGIAANPLKLDEKSLRYGESVTFCLNDKEGWLLKQSSKTSTLWNKRWFVLTGRCLYYFDDPSNSTPSFILPLEDVMVRPLKSNYFEIFAKNNQPLKAIKTNDPSPVKGHMELILRANDSNERDEWVNAISTETLVSPLSEIWKARHNKIKQSINNTNNNNVVSQVNNTPTLT